MNANQLTKKLQRAILTKGLIIKINTNQFYSDDQKRMITMWVLSTPVFTNTKAGWHDKDYEILRTASPIDVVKCLSDIWDSVKDWKR